MTYSKRTALAIVVGLSVIAAAEGHGRPRISVGLNFGGPPCRPAWCGCPPQFLYYRPAPVYVVAPAPRVILQPAPVVVQPETVVIPSQFRPTENLPPPPIQPAVALREASVIDYTGSVSRHLESLRNPDPSVRSSAVMELGRSKSDQAVAPLAATLAGDSSPEVRDAAARALGIIAAPGALPALRHAAQADSDRDVRRSSQFAVEIIQAGLRK